VLPTTGSAAQAGLAVSAGTIAIVVSGVFGGIVVDRLGPKRTSVIADLASGVTVALIPLLDRTVGLAFWQLLILVFVGALLDTPGRTARGSLILDLAPLAGFRLERVNTVIGIVSRLALLLTPPLAGVLIALLGTTNVLWIDAATFAVAAAIVAVAIPGQASAPPDQTAIARAIDDLAGAGDGEPAHPAGDGADPGRPAARHPAEAAPD
jgi:MFS family permease